MNSEWQCEIVGSVNEVVKSILYYVPTNERCRVVTENQVPIRVPTSEKNNIFVSFKISDIGSVYICISFDPFGKHTHIDDEYEDYFNNRFPYKFKFVVDEDNSEINNYYENLFNSHAYIWKYETRGKPIYALDIVVYSNEKDKDSEIKKAEESKYFVKWYRNQTPKLLGFYRSFKTLDVIRWRYAQGLEF